MEQRRERVKTIVVWYINLMTHYMKQVVNTLMLTGCVWVKFIKSMAVVRRYLCINI